MKNKKIIIENGIKYEVVKIIKDGKSEEELFFEKWSNETVCLEAVKQDGDSLQYVKNKKIFLKILKQRQ